VSAPAVEGADLVDRVRARLAGADAEPTPARVAAALRAEGRSYGDRGLVVLGFPCNQFGSQDPGSNEEISQFCQLNYGVSFPMMAKIDVNGGAAHPLYQWLTKEAPGVLGTTAIKWNFTKFLIGKDGDVIKRFAPQDEPAKLKKDIEKALA
jgi:glutathione peroxidase